MSGTARRDILARRRIGVVHGEVVRPRPWTKQAKGSVRTVAIAAWARDELQDFGAHEKISHSTIRISPLIASVIRQAAAAMQSSASVQGKGFQENKTRGPVFRAAGWGRRRSLIVWLLHRLQPLAILQIGLHEGERFAVVR